MTHRDHTKSTDSPPRVSVVVLTWNGLALTLDCLESLCATTYPNLEIIVVDNASSDGTAQALAERFAGRVSVVVNHENLGFAGGNNAGIRRALDGGSEFVLLLNNDTIVDPGLFEAMLSAFEEHPTTGIVGPKIYYAQPPDQIWFAGGEVFLSRGTARHIGIREIDTGQYDRDREVDYVTGCALLAKRGVFEAIGFLDDGYRAYYEDADFCMRARRSGYTIRYAARGIVWHKISSSTGGQVSGRKIRQKFKSSVRFFGRYASLHHWLTIPFFFLADVVRIIALVLSGRIKDASAEEPARGSGA